MVRKPSAALRTSHRFATASASVVSSQHSDGLRESLEHLLAAAIEQGIVIDATIAASLEQTKAFWHLRHVLPEIQKPEGGSIKHDVSVPVAVVPDFLAEASAAVRALIPGSRPVPFGISATATFTSMSASRSTPIRTVPGALG